VAISEDGKLDEHATAQLRGARASAAT